MSKRDKKIQRMLIGKRHKFNEKLNQEKQSVQNPKTAKGFLVLLILGVVIIIGLLIIMNILK